MSANRRSARSESSERRPAVVSCSCLLAAALAAAAPAGAEYGNDRVIRRVLQGEAPSLALSVSIGWSEGRGAAKSYSYEDTLSTPKLKVTNKRLIRYRLPAANWLE